MYCSVKRTEGFRYTLSKRLYTRSVSTFHLELAAVQRGRKHVQISPPRSRNNRQHYFAAPGAVIRCWTIAFMGARERPVLMHTDVMVEDASLYILFEERKRAVLL